MSRIAKKPLSIPDGVKVSINKDIVSVEGKVGKIQQPFLMEFVDIKLDNNKVVVDRKGDAGNFKAYQGLFYRLTQNLLTGVSQGFSKTLTIQGLGYKWEIKGKELILTVGFSKPAVYVIPDGVSLKIEAQNLTITGCDKQLVGQIAAEIRGIKPPEPYKGKGIRYSNEVIKLKEGKSAK